MREVWGSIPGPVKLDTVSPKATGRLAQLLSARYRYGRSEVRLPDRSNRHSVATAATFLRSCVAQALSSGDGPHNSLHASA